MAPVISKGGKSEGKQYCSDSGTRIRGKFLWCKELSSSKFMCLQRYQGRVKLHIRNYLLEEDEYVLTPTKRGAVLDKQQARDLMANVDSMWRVLKQNVSNL